MSYQDNARGPGDERINSWDSDEERRRKWHNNATRQAHEAQVRSEGQQLDSTPITMGGLLKVFYYALHVVPLLGIFWLPATLFRSVPEQEAGSGIGPVVPLAVVVVALVALWVQRFRARRAWTPAVGGTGRLRTKLFLSGLATWLIVSFLTPILGLAGAPAEVIAADYPTPWASIVALVIGSMLLARLLSRRGVAKAVRRGMAGWWQAADGLWYPPDAVSGPADTATEPGPPSSQTPPPAPRLAP